MERPAVFKKVLIANRGEIAVRIIRACRELGLASLALYEPADADSLHVRLADECVRLDSPHGFSDQAAILRLAQAKGAGAIHPGYGYLAEQAGFIRACAAHGLALIGPPAEVVERVGDRIGALQRARAAGFPTLPHSERSFGDDELSAVQAEAERLGWPLRIKSCPGGRGRGERLVRSPDGLEPALRQAQAEAQAVYGDRRVYLERTFPRAHQVDVQVLADGHGGLVHLGEREGSQVFGNQKLLVEAPAPVLPPERRQALWQAALELARLFGYQNAGSVEFVVGGDGQFYFTEIKARIQMDHPVTEAISGLDLVQAQIRLAAGEPLWLAQADVRLNGWAMQCRLSAEDPWNEFRPAPGRLERARWPGGPGVRVDTYAYAGCDVPGAYDPLIAKLIAWAPDRAACLARLRRALDETELTGTPTNIPLLQRILADPAFVSGNFDPDFPAQAPGPEAEAGDRLRDLAVAAAVLYHLRSQNFRPSIPSRWLSGWHRHSRRLPE